MPERFIPLADRVLVRPIQPEKKATGLAQVEIQKAKPTRGVVIATGPEARSKMIDPSAKPPIFNSGLRVGDIVEWNEYAGRDIKVNGEDLKRFRLEEIEGVWETTNE